MMELQAFALIAALASVVFAAHAGRISDVPWWLAGLVTGMCLLLPLPWLTGNRLPLLALPASQGALLLALAVFHFVHYDAQPRRLMACAGLITAAWIAALHAQGFPSVWSLGFPVLLSGLSLWMAGRLQAYSTPHMLIESKMILVPGAMAVALLPEAIRGWQSAGALQSLDGSSGQELPITGVLLALVFILLGLAYSRWKYR
jgi:hypothetical protein